MEKVEEKIGASIKLPVITGKRPTLTLLDGRKIQTSICEIKEISCNNNVYYVTISTKNSVYKAQTDIYNPDDNMNGQVLKEGKLVSTTKGHYATVKRILELNADYIIFLDADGNKLRGKL